MDGEGTGSTVLGREEERRAPGDTPRDGRDQVGDGPHPHEEARELGCGDRPCEDCCHCRHVDFLIGSYARVYKDAPIQEIDKLDDTTGGIPEDQAIFDNDMKSIQSDQEDYEAQLATILVQQQGMLDKMIKYLETVEKRMRELERRAGVPAPGPNVPRDPAPGVFGEARTTLRIAAEGVAPMEGPMELAPYGPPQVDPSLLRHTPRFSPSVMLGEEMQEKGSRICTSKRDIRQGTIETDMSSVPAAGTFGRDQIWTARRHGDARSLLPLPAQWECWKYPTWG